MITLSHKPYSLTIDPKLGGAITSFTHLGRDIFSPSPDKKLGVIRAACFPMAPYVNRIPDGNVSFDFDSYTLPQNHKNSSHPIHGVAWLKNWEVKYSYPERAVISYTHKADEHWPWDFMVEQEFVLSVDGLSVQMNVTNTGDSDMPAGAGFHPYFERERGTQLDFHSQGFWQTDKNGISKREIESPYDNEFVSDAAGTDHSFFGFDGIAEITRPDGSRVNIQASQNCIYGHVYVPRGEDFFSFEPTTSRSHPFMKGSPAFTRLPPREALEIWMKVGVSPKEP